jgi:hypothetical protein
MAAKGMRSAPRLLRDAGGGGVGAMQVGAPGGCG